MIQRALSIPRCSLKATSTAPLSKRLASTTTLSSISPLSARLAFNPKIMSNLPAKPSLDLSLPSRPSASFSTSTTTRATPLAGPSLLSRISHALPAKPSVAPPAYASESYSRPRESRQEYRYNDTYIPRSPSPPFRRYDDYDSYIPRSPPPRSFRDRDDSYIPSPSRSPVSYRSRSPRSPRRSSYSSASPVKRSVSPVKRPRSPSEELPKTFYTHSHKKQEQRALAEEESKRKRKEAEDARRAIYLDRQEARKAQEEERRAKYQAVQATISANKRTAEETPLGQPPAKLHKPIPTGPRASLASFASTSAPGVPGAPTGPRPRLSARPIRTGPRALATASYTTSAQSFTPDTHRGRSPTPRLGSASPSRSLLSPEMTQQRNASSSRRPFSKSKSPKTPRTPKANNGAGRAQSVDGPVYDEKFIVKAFWENNKVDPKWSDQPKQYLAGLMGLPEAPEPIVDEVIVQGQKMFRATMGINDGQVMAIGDASKKKSAENLSCLSALLQLSVLSSLEPHGQYEATLTAEPKAEKVQPSGELQPPAGEEVAQLSDGTFIGYDRARQFMEYYCNRYKFGKPDLQYSETRTKGRKGKHNVGTWEAVMSVGNRKIGVGAAKTKKLSQIKCYLDVAQYLESCDAGLWRDFIEKHKATTGRLVPHLVFQMSDGLNEDVQGLCTDIKNSTLCKNAPEPNMADQDQAVPAFQGGRVVFLDKEQSEARSKELSERLDKYQEDPGLAKMRAQRDSLPVKSRYQDILKQIDENDVTIIMAATGSGKTTQIPQVILDQWIQQGRGADCNVLCTQPRRLAATSVAERIADERGQRLGNEVGYIVRFDSKPPQPNGSITFCTTGIFLKKMHSSMGAGADTTSSAAMDQVTHVVVDEVHERDIDTDLSLVVLKRLLAERKARGIPLKVILMSATIDPTLFKNYFKNDQGLPAPVAEVPGRTFPVKRHWLDDILPELQKNPSTRAIFSDKLVQAYLNQEMSPDKSKFGPNTGMDTKIPYPLVALVIAHVLRQSDDGHVLVFLPGWDEIKKVADVLLASNTLGTNFNDASKYSVHYLHSTIPAAEQRQVFTPPPPGVRRIILATNIAETSVTIPDVVYVVDTGRVKESRYDPVRHMTSLVSAWVGSSNLNQRAGRAGRHREGEYYGIVSQNRLQSLDAHQTVEMKRSDLSNVVMHVKALNLGAVEDVLAETIEPPAHTSIVSAMESLRMLGAMDDEKNLTPLGRVLLQIPVDAAIGKLCLYGSFFRCLDSALTLAAALTTRDPFMCPPARKYDAQRIKDSWSPLAFRSDALAIVSAYNTWYEMDQQGQYGRTTQWCNDNFLSKSSLLQMKQVKESLLSALQQAGVISVSAGGKFMPRMRRMEHMPPQLNENGNSLPLLAALISVASAPNFAIRISDKACRTSQDPIVFIHPSSVNAKNREAGGPAQPSASFNPAEKRLYAFAEKSFTGAVGTNKGMTYLRNVTRLDPMSYMLFGAYKLYVTQDGLECDSWLPVAGNLHALDDIQRLKTLLDRCMLRLYEGVGRSLTKGRDQRRADHRDNVRVVPTGSSVIEEPIEDNDESVDEGENESEDEEDVPQKRIVEPLSREEITEMQLLTTDVVRILDAYSAEREGDTRSTLSSRPSSPMGRPRSPPRGPRAGGAFGYRSPRVDIGGNGDTSAKW